MYIIRPHDVADYLMNELMPSMMANRMHIGKLKIPISMIAKKIDTISHICLLVVLFCLTACHPVDTEQQTLPMDSLILHVFHAVLDTNVSCLDYQDEFMMLMDTMQMHVESYPDKKVRIGAKSLVMDLLGLFVYGDCTTPEEDRFFDDSLLQRIINIQSAWYMPAYVLNGITDTLPVLTQTIVLRYDDNTNHVVGLNLYFFPDGDEGMVVTLPVEAESLVSIVFRQKNMMDIDTALIYTIADASYMQERSEDIGQIVLFGKDLIDAMLTHEGMYLAYFGTEEAEDLADLIHKCHLDLKQFHNQYQQVKELTK